MTRIDRPKGNDFRFRLECIFGDCLKAVGICIQHGGFAVIHAGAIPKVGDIVHCRKHPDTLSSYIKQVKAIDGDSIIVGTAYKDFTRDYTFEASDVHGVVEQVFEKFSGKLLYSRYNTKKGKHKS